jgi:preprotein translocase subunit SecB
MNTSPLQLLRYVTSDISCSANPAFVAAKPYDPGAGQPAVTITATRQPDPADFQGHLWALELTVSHSCSEGQNFPYNFKVALLGFFAFRNGSATSEAEQQFVRVNGSSMLYGAAREIVRSMTSRGPWEELFLPGVSFYDPPKVETPKPPPSESTKQEESAD